MKKIGICAVVIMLFLTACSNAAPELPMPSVPALTVPPTVVPTAFPGESVVRIDDGEREEVTETPFADNTEAPVAETQAPEEMATELPKQAESETNGAEDVKVEDIRPANVVPATEEKHVVKIDGSAEALFLSRGILEALHGDWQGVEHSGTREAFVKLAAGDADIIFVTYPTKDEMEIVGQAGVEIVPVAKDALVFFNNEENPVSRLTKEQAMSIYKGEIVNWKDVGGLNERIVVAELEKYDNAANALGFCVFADVMSVGANARLLAVDGVVPTLVTIAADEYPYVNYYYAVVRKDSPFRDVVDWLLRDEGQKIVEKAGYVPLKAEGGGDEKRNEVPAGYGFFGSTVENTRFSVGTGGAVERIAKDYGLYLAELPDGISGEAKKIIDEWVNDTRLLLSDEYPFFSYFCAGDLISVITRMFDERGELENVDTAVFDVSVPKRLKLSDLFFNGINYIAYINENLTKNISLSELFEGQDIKENIAKSPFTGIPEDYPYFAVTNVGVLEIYFREDNPFFNDVWRVEFVLPRDLSPFGRAVFEVAYEKIQADNGVFVVVPQIQSEFGRKTVIDEKINAKMMEFAETVQKSEVFAQFVKKQADNFVGGNVRYAPRLTFGQKRLTIFYDEQPFANEEADRPTRTICGGTFDLETGEMCAVLKEEMPKNWNSLDFDGYKRLWLVSKSTPMGEIVFSEELEGYIVAEDAVITDIFLADYGFCQFTAVLPNGDFVLGALFGN